ncbi:hypothetical protein [Emticicia agri]|uniref:Uncharacterized protein n=1 Tax=Emticicia agri TaxID=2492393 RepID=A0A4Q5M4I5_9BACT|nr:hypothetical protein [Emticicia agri]RYU97376.1 hypothetical protein EWM59_01415 [Emticicia agri]
MQKTNKFKSKIAFLAYYQIAGGTVGILLLIWLIASTFPVQGMSILLYLLMAVFFGLSICSGWLLIEKRIEAGLTLSKINQILQIFGLAFGGFAFEYVAGVAVFIGINLEDSASFMFNFSFSKLELYVNSSKDFAKVEVNLIAIYLVYLIIKLQNAIASDRRLGVSEEDA